ncbi:eye-specific diacylglycerol kinase isoform X3 [Hyposmocoma kahamanoa]|uniref:eye-specific diacylglycerol kinase isoform X3 n=1 Tax=Hyposmocoma kahamanoa TaxID=1477025 RepID=UPI000E6D5F5D|nr:eye-specific diacylglycerol kinase isoform X3 [Hyposmocoma kahamanoa]
MQRLRTTFKRSRTPTPQDMKSQSSLEVPKQVRSASFDEIQLEAARGAGANVLLAVPQHGARSRSFDSAGSDDSGTYLEVPRLWSRRRSGKGTPPPCVHCRHMETWLSHRSEERTTPERLPVSASSSADDDDDDDESEVESPRVLLAPPPPPRTYLPPKPPTQSPPPSPGAPSFELQPPNDEPPVLPQRRRSISRQEAFFVEPTGSSLENVRASEDCATQTQRDPLVHDIYLAVPELKRDRAASVDSCFSKVSGARAEELSGSGDYLTVPGTGLRSRSVDIVLPTAEQSRYKALALTSAQAPPPLQNDKVPQEPAVQPAVDNRRGGDTGGARVLRSTPEWSDGAINGEHLWSPTSVSGDCCYVGDAECQKHGSRMKCSACKIVAHTACIDILMDRLQFTCKPTFRDVGVRQYREQTITHHHWVHRRSEKGKCKACGKSFRCRCCKWCLPARDKVNNPVGDCYELGYRSLQAKLSFSSKEIVALSCSWCKDAYHNKESCFNLQRIGEECCLGSQCNIIVPPSWIVKLPRRGSFKSSLRKSPKKKNSSKKKGKDSKNELKTFVIKPIPTTNVKPVLVFINPKSGGNQGAKLLQKFQWLLNPRQVFDLTQGGPGPGLELYRKVPNLRVLACGGDGTVGWVLSVLDRIGSRPAVGVLPLGTGNDLARALGWGGGYEDEPISKILAHIGESDTVLLDRWQLTVEPNTSASGEDTTHAKPELPLNVVNNYFSFGVDAHIALEFHEAREAHPEKFNSRIRNKLFYGTAGGKDLMQRKWKGLADFVTMECDGKDLTPVLREHKVHAIVFLNIPSYGGGTHPWNKSGGAYEPSTEDGLIEVVGLTTYQLPLLQAGGHGTCITQCKTAKIVTTKVIPMQVDGEACRLAPSVITLSRLNQAIMLAKRKPGRVIAPQTTLDKLTLTVNLITMADYERHHYDKELLAKTVFVSAERVGTLEVNPATDLEQMRTLIQNMIKESQAYSNLVDWWFVDSVTAERFFRIDKAQENLHYSADIGNENIYILDAAPLTPDTESTAPPDTTATASLDRTGPSVSLDTTTGLSVSLDISQSVDTPSAGVSLDVPESHASESGFGSPARTSEELLTPQTPPPSIPVSHAPKLSVHSAPKLEAQLMPKVTMALTQDSNSPPLCTSPPARDHQPTHDSIARFKTNLLEKTSDALLKAAKVGDLKLMKELHAAGYSLLSIDASGQTALHIAARYGNKEIVKYLIACAPTAILNMRDNERGQTALHKAAAHKRRAICCMLVAGGASLTRQDHAGLTPRALALRADDHDLAAYLESQEHFQLVSEDLETAV